MKTVRRFAALGLNDFMRASKPADDDSLAIAIPKGLDVDKRYVKYVTEVAQTVFGVSTKVVRFDMLSAYDLDYAQYDGDIVIEYLVDLLPSTGCKRVVCLIDGDARACGRNFVFGYAHLRNRTSLVSLARLRETWYGRAHCEKRFRSRLFRVLVHELGHTYGNRHCEDQNCVMQPVSYVESLDALPVNYCRECLHRVLTASRPDIWPVIWSGVPKNWSQHPKYGY